MALLARLPRLETGRLILRPFTLEDFKRLRSIHGDPEVLRYRSRPEITADQTREFLEQAAAGDPEGRFPFAIELRLSGTLIGEIGLTRLPEDPAQAFAWYSLNREHWGQGCAAEALGRLLEFGFREAGLERIRAECHPQNRASERVMQKCGLLPFPERRMVTDADGQVVETLCYAIDRQAWLERSADLDT